MTFMCTRMMYNGGGPRYIRSSDDLNQLDDSVVYLSCYIDDFFLAFNELNDIEDKEVKFLVRISENVFIRDYVNLFDTFMELERYKDAILGLELNLSSKVNDVDFLKLITFLSNVTNKFDFVLNLGNLEVFDNGQLSLLRELNSNIYIKLKINQSYEGRERENNDYDKYILKNGNYFFIQDYEVRKHLLQKEMF